MIPVRKDAGIESLDLQRGKCGPSLKEKNKANFSSINEQIQNETKSAMKNSGDKISKCFCIANYREAF